MRNEVKRQIDRITAQIEAEKKIHEAWSNYTDSTMKTMVIHQSIGVIRGLETAKEALEFVLAHDNVDQMQLEFVEKVESVQIVKDEPAE